MRRRDGRPPAPPAGTEAARAAYRQRTDPDDLVPLLWDSDTDGPGGCAGPARGRTLLFGRHGVGVELQVAGPSRRSLRVRLLTPAAAGRAAVAVVLGGGRRVALCPVGGGTFTATDVPPGLARLRLARAGRRPMLTAWVLLD